MHVMYMMVCVRTQWLSGIDGKSTEVYTSKTDSYRELINTPQIFLQALRNFRDNWGKISQ